MSSGREKFKKFIKQAKIAINVVTLPSSTHTAKEAAEAVGCQVGQIAKSIIFKTSSGKPILVITSGANRVNEEKLEKILGEKIQKAEADFVKEATGYVIGGVPPFAHRQKIKTFIDRDLFKFLEVWASAGDPFSVFKTTAGELQKISEAQPIKVN